MKQKTLAITLCIFFFSALISIGCKKTKDDNSSNPPIAGTPGNPRFNLQFTNPENVDLDLHVITPNKNEIYFGQPAGDNGSLDVDCLCGDCPNGPNENIFWTEGSAPHGTYSYWVEYFGDCGTSSNASSDFTLRLMKNSTVLKTFTGTLNTEGEKSTVYTFTY